MGKRLVFSDVQDEAQVTAGTGTAHDHHSRSQARAPASHPGAPGGTRTEHTVTVSKASPSPLVLSMVWSEARSLRTS